MIILITGITSGFGRAMAKKLAQEGHKVYGTYRKDSEPLEGVTYIKCEVTDDAQAVELAGGEVKLVPNSVPNPKITVPEDIRTVGLLMGLR